jgi:hypothetical protein
LKAQIASFHCTPFLLHILKMMVNVVVTSLPTTECLIFQHVVLFSILLNSVFFFSTLPLLLLCSFVLTSLCFLLLCYSLQFFNHIFCTHVFMNSKTSKTQTTFGNKRKQLFNNYSVYFHPRASHPSHSFFDLPTIF